jgi:hypothetical protein
MRRYQYFSKHFEAVVMPYCIVQRMLHPLYLYFMCLGLKYDWLEELLVTSQKDLNPILKLRKSEHKKAI